MGLGNMRGLKGRFALSLVGFLALGWVGAPLGAQTSGDPIQAYLERARSEVAEGFKNGGTGGALDSLESYLKPFATSGQLPFSHDDFRSLALKIGGGRAVKIEVRRTAANVAEANRRLERMGVDYLVIAQASEARLVELVREYYHASHPSQELLQEIFRLSHAQDPMADERSVYYLPMLPDEVDKANAKLESEKRYQKFRADPRIKSEADVPLYHLMRDPFPHQRKSFDRLVETRTFLNLTLPLALGPAMGVLMGGNFQFGSTASAALSSVLEYQFVKPVNVMGKKILGNAFWTRQVAHHGQKLIIGLNVLYPALCTLAGAAAAALAGETYAFNTGDMIVHPFFSLITFGVLSFGYAQTQGARQLEQGYADRFHQFRFETISQLLLNVARVVAGAAAFFQNQELFEFLGAKFNVGHVIGYGAQLTYAATISTGLFWRHHLGLRAIDQRIRSHIAPGASTPGLCSRISAWVATRYTLGH